MATNLNAMSASPALRFKNIVFVLPCCIGDVILATAALSALRRGFPEAHITWAVGSWSKNVIQHHPDLNAVLDTGAEANPVKSPVGLLRFVRLLRAGRYDLMISLVRSPLMSVAALLSGIPVRAGLDSAGRGFGYTLRAPVDPDQPRHEAEIYLSVIRTLGIETDGIYANLPVHEADRAAVRQRLAPSPIIDQPYIVVHPGGGRNPGMTLDAKRYPPDKLAALASTAAAHLHAAVIVIGAPSDQPLVDAVQTRLTRPHAAMTDLTFGEIAALAAGSSLYIGSDTGMTHLAASVGAKTAAIFGPTDPRRYAPFGRDVLTLWRPAAVSSRGVAASPPHDWDWDRDGIALPTAESQLLTWLS